MSRLRVQVTLGQRWLPPLLVAMVGVTVLLAYLAAGRQRIGTSDREAFSLRDDAWRQSSASILDTPFAMPWLPSSVLSRASIWIALGRKSALRDFAAVASAASAVMFAAMLLQSGRQLFPTLLATLGMAFGASFWMRGVTWSLDALAPICAIAAAMAGREWLSHGSSKMLIAAAVAALVAVVEDPAWIACLPALAILVWIRVSDRSRVPFAAIATALVLSALAALLLRLDVIRHPSWAALLRVDSPGLWSMWVFEARSGWTSMASMISREFTAVGSVLLVIGLVRQSGSATGRLAFIALVAGIVGARYLVPQLRPEEAGPAVAVLGWTAVALGLEWIGSTAVTAAAVTTGIVGVLVVAQPALTRLRMAELSEARSPMPDGQSAYNLKLSDLPAKHLLIASSRDVDSMVRLSSGLTGVATSIVPQRGELVESALKTQRAVLAFPGTREQLSSIGFVFERFFAGNESMSTAVGRQACEPLTADRWTDISLQLDSGSFSVRSETPSIQTGHVTIYMAAPRSIFVDARDRVATPYGVAPLPDNEGAEARKRLEEATARGGGISGWPITVLEVTSAGVPAQAIFSLSEVPQAAVAVSTLSPTVTICAASSRTDLALKSAAGSASARLISGQTFGVGWHSPEGGDDTFRWTANAEASIRAHVNRPGPIRAIVTAMPAAPASSQPRVGLVVNSCDLPTQPLVGLQDVSWIVPADCWKTGANQLWFRSGPHVSPASLGYGGDTRLLGARVSVVRLEQIGR